MDEALLNHPLPTLVLDDRLNVHAASRRAQRLLGLEVIGQRFSHVWTQGGPAAEQRCRTLAEHDDEDDDAVEGIFGGGSGKRRRRAFSVSASSGGAARAGSQQEVKDRLGRRRPSFDPPQHVGAEAEDDTSATLPVTFVPFELRYVIVTTNPTGPPNLPSRRFRLSISTFTPTSTASFGGFALSPGSLLAQRTGGIRLGTPTAPETPTAAPTAWFIVALLPPDPDDLVSKSPQPEATKGAILVKSPPRESSPLVGSSPWTTAAPPALAQPHPVRPSNFRHGASYARPAPSLPPLVSPGAGPAPSFFRSTSIRGPPSTTTSSADDDRHPLLGHFRRSMLDAVDLPMHAMSTDETLSIFNASGASLFQVSVPERVSPPSSPSAPSSPILFGTVNAPLSLEHSDASTASSSPAKKKQLLAAWKLFDPGFRKEYPVEAFPMKRAMRGDVIIEEHFGCEMPDGQRRTMSIAARPIRISKAKAAELLGRRTAAAGGASTGMGGGQPVRPGFSRMGSAQSGRSGWGGADAFPPTVTVDGEEQQQSSKGEEEDEVVGGVVWVRDITDLLAQKKADEEHRAQLRGEALAAEEADKLKSAFIGSLSHEIRTPIASILGITDLLVDSPLSTEQREFADTIKSAGSALLALIGDVLDLSKIESGKLDIESVPFDARELVGDVEKVFAFSSRGKMTSFSSEVDVPDEGRDVVGDPGRIRQILNNLLSNAIKFTPSGAVRFSVNMVVDSPTHVSLHASVRDTGIGMTRDTLRKLYKPFTQADRSTSRVWGGSGLGLSIVKRLVEAMGGTVKLESEGLGKGTLAKVWIRFLRAQPAVDGVEMEEEEEEMMMDDQRRESDATVLGQRGSESPLPTNEGRGLSPLPSHPVLLPSWSLAALGGTTSDRSRSISSIPSNRSPSPASMSTTGLLPPSPANVASPSASSRASTGPSGSTTLERLTKPRSEYRILVAEDNQVMAKITLATLNKRGFSNVELVQDGKQAVEAVERRWKETGQKEGFDLGLIDVMMPVMDGHEASRAIRTVMQGRWMPIIALTASAVRGDREKCLAASMDDYLTKPLRADLLEQRVVHHLSKLDAAQQADDLVRTSSPAPTSP